MNTENSNFAKPGVCTMCGHEHGANATCACGCAVENSNVEVCTMCGHKHEMKGNACDCGCDARSN